MAKGVLHLNVEFSAVTDEEGRFGRLATLLGLVDADHARGKCEHLWLACTRRGESDLPQWLVEQLLGARGPDALVEAELASWAAGRGDSSCRRLRIGGAAKHCLWMSSSKDQLKHEQRVKGGELRAKTSSRKLDGTFASRPAEYPAPSSSSEITAEILPESVSPARDPAVPDTTPDAIPPPDPIPTASQRRAEIRRRLIGRCWDMAGAAFRELGGDGIEPGAHDPWRGMPGSGDPGMDLLIKLVDRLLIGEPPDAERVADTMTRRIAVAVAEARAADPPTRRWVTPMRLWDPASFAKGAENSPEQVRPRGARAGPKSNGATGRVEPPPPEAFRRGDQKL